MAVQSILCTAGVDLFDDVNSWVTPNNITSDDGSLGTRASCAYSHPGFPVSDKIRGSFSGFTLPPTAVLNGLVFSFRRQSPGNASITDNVISLAISGAEVGDNKSIGATWDDAAPEVVMYGSAVDLWNSGVTIADLNAGLVSVNISALAGVLGSTILANGFRLDAYYTGKTNFISVQTDG